MRRELVSLPRFVGLRSLPRLRHRSEATLAPRTFLRLCAAAELPSSRETRELEPRFAMQFAITAASSPRT